MLLKKTISYRVHTEWDEMVKMGSFWLLFAFYNSKRSSRILTIPSCTLHFLPGKNVKISQPAKQSGKWQKNIRASAAKRSCIHILPPPPWSFRPQGPDLLSGEEGKKLPLRKGEKLWGPLPRFGRAETERAFWSCCYEMRPPSPSPPPPDAFFLQSFPPARPL